MARKKRTSPVLARANTRANGLQSIDAALDLGNGLTLDNYTNSIELVQGQLDVYNQKLSAIDKSLNDLEMAEGDLDELSSRMLAAVGVKHGKNSTQYEQAGGTRTSERKSPVRRTTTVAA